MHRCTCICHAGYHYDVPFLQDGIVDSSRSHVRPLYQHMFNPEVGPSLSFIGLTFKVVPFPQYELQCKYVARMLSGRVPPPERAEMEEWMKAHYNDIEHQGVKDRHVHRLGEAQWEYNDWLAEQCGPDVEQTPDWRIALWRHTRAMKANYAPDTYRNMWDNESITELAQAELKKAYKNIRLDKRQLVHA
jgi:hypothetical protein